MTELFRLGVMVSSLRVYCCRIVYLYLAPGVYSVADIWIRPPIYQEIVRALCNYIVKRLVNVQIFLKFRFFWLHLLTRLKFLLYSLPMAIHVLVHRGSWRITINCRKIYVVILSFPRTDFFISALILSCLVPLSLIQIH